MNGDSVLIRRASTSDAPAITAIYNEAVANSVATFDTEAKTIDDRRSWLESHDDRHPVVVADSGGEVVGWAALTAWSDRAAYRGTGETTLYIDAAHRGQRIGTMLLEALTVIAREQDFHTLIARITDGGDASIRLHKAQGF